MIDETPRVTEERLREMVSLGMSDLEIAEDLGGISFQRVQQIRSKYGITRRHRAAGKWAEKRLLPWTVTAVDSRDQLHRVLALYVKRERGEKLTKGDESRLNRFLERLNRLNLVVDYSPETGWVTRRRQSWDTGPMREPADPGRV